MKETGHGWHIFTSDKLDQKRVSAEEHCLIIDGLSQPLTALKRMLI